MAEIENFARYYVIKELGEKISQVNYIKLKAEIIFTVFALI